MVVMREERERLVVDGENYRLAFQKERGVVDLSLPDANGHVPVNLQLPGSARPDMPPGKLPGCGFYFGSAPHLTYQVKPHIDARQKGDEVIISEGFDFGTSPSFYLVVNYRCTSDAVYIATQYFVSPGAPLKDWSVWHLPPELRDSLFRAGPSFVSSDRFFSHCQFRDGEGRLCAEPVTSRNGPTYGVCAIKGLEGKRSQWKIQPTLPYLSLFSDRTGMGMTCVYLDYVSVWAPNAWFVPPFGHFLQLLAGNRAAVHTGLVRGYLHQPHRMAILFGKEKGTAVEKRVRQVLRVGEGKPVRLAQPGNFHMKLTRRIPDAPDSKECIAFGVHTGLAGWGWWIPWFKTCLPRQLGPYLKMLSRYPKTYYNMEISPDSFRESLKKGKGLKYLKQIRQMVSAGKAEMVGATFGQPFNPLASGECNVRHLQLGVRYTEKVTGKKVISYYTDEPGIAAQLPQILKSMGFRYAVMRGVTSRFGQYPVVEKENFWWRGLDGTVIEATGTTQRSPGGEFGLDLTVIYDRLRRLARKGVKRHLAIAVADLPYGRDLDEPGFQFPASRIEMMLASPQVESTTISGYFEKTGRPRDKDTVSFHPDSFIVWDYWGSMRSDPCHTAARRAENTILAGERLSAFTEIFGEPGKKNRPELEEAWANLLVSQHHDLRCGPDWTTEKGIEVAQKADGIGARIIKRGLGALKRLAGTRGKGESVLVFNPLPWPRRALIETDLPLQAKTKRGKAAVCVDLPAFGWRAFDPAAEVSKDSADLRVSARSRCIENEFYRVKVNQAGLITSIYDKGLGREMLRKPGNELTGYRADKKAWVSSRKSKGTVTILDQRPAAVAVRVKGLLGDIPYSTEIKLISGIRRIEITTSLDYGKGVAFGKEKKQELQHAWNPTYAERTASTPYTRFKLKVGFHPDLVSPRCYRELSFGATQCKPLKDWTQAGMPYYADTIHGVSWAEMSDGKCGLAILNKGTMGYHRTEDSLSLILGYGGGRHRPLKGKCTVEYAIVTHSGTYRNENLVRAGQEYNLPTPAAPIRGGAEDMPSDTCSLFRMEGAANAVVSAILVEDKHLIIRVAETAGRSARVKLRFFVPVRKVQLVELDGRVLSDVPVKKEVVEVGLKKWEFRTLRIKVDAPANIRAI